MADIFDDCLPIREASSDKLLPEEGAGAKSDDVRRIGVVCCRVNEDIIAFSAKHSLLALGMSGKGRDWKSGLSCYPS